MIDTVMAAGLGITFRELPRESITTMCNSEGIITPYFFVADFKPDGAKLRIASLMQDIPTTVPGAQDNLLPTPCNVAMARDTVYLPIESGDSQSDAPPRWSPPLPPVPKSPTFRPRSPTHGQIDARSPERPPSWYPQGAIQPRSNSCTRPRTPHGGMRNNPVTTPLPTTPGCLSVPPPLPSNDQRRPRAPAPPPLMMPVPPVQPASAALLLQPRIEQLPLLADPRKPRLPHNSAMSDLQEKIARAVELEVGRRITTSAHGPRLAPRLESLPHPMSEGTRTPGRRAHPRGGPIENASASSNNPTYR